MSKSIQSESTTGRQANKAANGGLVLEGRISRQTLIQLDLDDGSTVVAPEEILLKPGSLGDIGDIIDIACKITGWCGDKDPGGGGGGKVCYKTVVSPDGTITISPVPCPKQE